MKKMAWCKQGEIKLNYIKINLFFKDFVWYMIWLLIKYIDIPNDYILKNFTANYIVMLMNEFILKIRLERFIYILKTLNKLYLNGLYFYVFDFSNAANFISEYSKTSREKSRT